MNKYSLQSLKRMVMAIASFFLMLAITFLSHYIKIFDLKGLIPSLLYLGLFIFFIWAGITGFKSSLIAIKAKEPGVVKHIGLVGNGLVVLVLGILVVSVIFDFWRFP